MSLFSNQAQEYSDEASVERENASVSVLVVEDNWVACEIVKATLESRGYAVLLASNGKTAMEIMANRSCDLVLLDLMLPDVEGATLLERLRRLPGGEEVPILAFSAFVCRLEDLRKMGARFNGYIAKPVEPLELIRIVEEHLRNPSPTPSPALYAL